MAVRKMVYPGKQGLRTFGHSAPYPVHTSPRVFAYPLITSPILKKYLYMAAVIRKILRTSNLHQLFKEVFLKVYKEQNYP